MIREFAYGAVAAAALTFAPLAASAATITVEANAPASWAAVDPALSLETGDGNWAIETGPSVRQGSVASNYKSPFDPDGACTPACGGLDNWAGISYYTVGSPGFAQSPAVLAYGGVMGAFQLLWGSVDTYNALEFLKDGVVTALVHGQQVLDEGASPAASGAALVSIEVAGGFDMVRFWSNYGPDFPAGTDSAAFEFSNISATPIPVPAAGLLLLSALGGMAVIRRRRKDA